MNQEQKLRWWGLRALILAIFLWLYPFPDVGPLQAVADKTAMALFLIAVVIAIANSVGSLESYEFGRRTIAGRQRGDTIGPGIFLILPVVGGIVKEDTKLRTISVDSALTTRRLKKEDPETPTGKKVPEGAGLKVTIEGSVQYKLNPEIKGDDEQIVCLGVTKEAIEEGLRNAIQTKIIVFGGAVDGEELVANVASLRDFVNCALQCAKMPHLSHTANGDCGVLNCSFGEGTKIAAQDLLGFYSTHFDWLTSVTKKEVVHFSPIEKQYGITVVVGGYEVGKILFSAETQADFEAAQRAQRLADAVLKKIDLVKQAVAAGLEPDGAADLVESTVVGAKRTILSVRGASPDAGVVAHAISTLSPKGGGKS